MNLIYVHIYNYVPVFHLMEVIKIVADRSRWYTKKLLICYGSMISYFFSMKNLKSSKMMKKLRKGKCFVRATIRRGPMMRDIMCQTRQGLVSILSRVATKIFEGFGEALFKLFIIGREPVSTVHYTRSGTCINRPLN